MGTRGALQLHRISFSKWLSLLEALDWEYGRKREHSVTRTVG